MSKLIFICDKLLTPEIMKKTNIPFKFISFASLLDGKMYIYWVKQYGFSTFLTKEEWERRPYYSKVVYGGLFLIKKNFKYHIRTLDGLYSCSLSRIGKNDETDLFHRKKVKVSTIEFETLENFTRHIYIEHEPVSCYAYIANLKHEIFAKRINLKSYQIHALSSGVDSEHFINLYKEQNKIKKRKEVKHGLE